MSFSVFSTKRALLSKSSITTGLSMWHTVTPFSSSRRPNITSSYRLMRSSNGQLSITLRSAMKFTERNA